MDNTKILIVGDSGNGHEIAELVARNHYNNVIVVDSNKELTNSNKHDILKINNFDNNLILNLLREEFMDTDMKIEEEVIETEEILPDTTNDMLNAISSNSLGRLPDESFENYKKRRHIDKIVTKFKLKGKVFWDSSKKGQYIRGMR